MKKMENWATLNVAWFLLKERLVCECLWVYVGSMIELFQSSELLRIKQTKCNRDTYA